MAKQKNPLNKFGEVNGTRSLVVDVLPLSFSQSRTASEWEHLFWSYFKSPEAMAK
jgi:hypothetical protein